MSNSTGLFEQADESYRPLAERMRPRTLDDLVGQKHLMVRGAPLEVARRTRKVQTIILHGPQAPGRPRSRAPWPNPSTPSSLP
ncbi:hypothetical protein ACFSC4_21385 [Deinococcus malanensis]|uniref:hypothetical protein n=1 Tax=Deinococcus malanensis TaxID=1706855 RepID=UPI003637AEE6